MVEFHATLKLETFDRLSEVAKFHRTLKMFVSMVLPFCMYCTVYTQLHTTYV